MATEDVRRALLAALAVFVEFLAGCGGEVTSVHLNPDDVNDGAPARRDSGRPRYRVVDSGAREASVGHRVVDSGTRDVSIGEHDASIPPDSSVRHRPDGAPVAEGGLFQHCRYDAAAFAADASTGVRCEPPVVPPAALDNLVLPASDCTGAPFDAGNVSRWIRCMPGNGPNGPNISDMALVPPDGVVVAGTSLGGWDVGCGRLPLGTIAFAARYDGSGACVWSTPIVTVSDILNASGGADSISADAAGNTVITGARSGPVTLGGRALDGVLNSHRGFVARLDAAGKVEWALDVQPNLWPGGNPDVLATMDASGDVYFVGHSRPSLGIDDCAFTVPVLDGAYLARLDRLGRIAWLRTLSEYELGGLAVANGRIVLVGSGGGLYVRSFDTGGEELWVRRFPVTGQGILRGVAIAPDGRIATTGIALGDLTIGGRTLHGGGFGGDPVFVVLDGDGNLLHDRIFNQTDIPDVRYFGGASAIGVGIAFDASNDIFVLGNFSNTIDFGGGPLGIPGVPLQSFAVVFDSDLQHLRSRAFAGYSANIKLGCDGSLNVATSRFVARSL